MCVASGEWSTSTGSNPSDSTPSNSRSPDPKRTGATSSVSSSITSGGERLTDGRGAARDVDAILAGRLTRLRVCGLEALGDEVEARAALHLDRLAGVVGEHEDRRVVGRLGAPPSIPVLIPLAADRPEHVAAHHVGPARSHEPALCRRVGVVRALVAEVPAMDLPAALPQRILPALVRPGDEAIERDRHVAGGVRHQRPPSNCGLQASAPQASQGWPDSRFHAKRHFAPRGPA